MFFLSLAQLIDLLQSLGLFVFKGVQTGVQVEVVILLLGVLCDVQVLLL